MRQGFGIRGSACRLPNIDTPVISELNKLNYILIIAIICIYLINTYKYNLDIFN